MIDYSIAISAENKENFIGALKQILKELEYGHVIIDPDLPCGWGFYGPAIDIPWTFFVNAEHEKPRTPEEEAEFDKLIESIGGKRTEDGMIAIPAQDPHGPKGKMIDAFLSEDMLPKESKD